MTPASTHDVPPSPGPYCGELHECATSLGRRAPTAGDVAVCLECAGVAVYAELLQLRRPTAVELARLQYDRDVLVAVDTVQRAAAWRRSRRTTP